MALNRVEPGEDDTYGSWHSMLPERCAGSQSGEKTGRLLPKKGVATVTTRFNLLCPAGYFTTGVRVAGDTPWKTRSEIDVGAGGFEPPTT